MMGLCFPPLRQFITDKEYVKQYITSIVGRQYTIDTMAILRTRDEVRDFAVERAPCVAKPTHMSGQVMFIRSTDTPLDKAMMRRWLRTSYYKVSRESNYRFLQPKVIVEEFFEDGDGIIPLDYKIHCFFGTPRLIQVDHDRFGGHTRNIYDPDWRLVDIEWAYPRRTAAEQAPSKLGLMLEIATALSENLPYIRVDMYASDREVKVGEMTSCPDGAKRRMTPRCAEIRLGTAVRRDQCCFLVAGRGRESLLVTNAGC